MIRQEEISIEKLIIHILDTTLDIPVLSDELHPLNEDIHNFIIRHIAKSFDDENIKTVKFTEDNNYIFGQIKDVKDNFIENTKNIASAFFNFIKNHPAIPSSDMIFVLFRFSNINYFSIFKFNYKTSYIHHIDSNESGRLNSIVEQKTALPNATQKLEEGVFINLQNYEANIIEKKYDIEGKKQFYISKYLLKTTSDLSSNEKMKIINKVNKKIVKEYLNNDADQLINIEKNIRKNLNNENEVNINKISQETFKDNKELENIYKEELKSNGIEEDSFKLNPKTNNKVYRKKKITTDNGIEISVPLLYLDKDDKIEFITNADGTISIIIKNINNIEKK